MNSEAKTYTHPPGRCLGVSHTGMFNPAMKPKHAILPKKPPVFARPRERFSQMLIRMRQLEGNPHYIALGMAVGIFVSMTPIIPLQTIVAVALAYLFRGSKSAAALGTWLSNPLTIPVVYYAAYKLGCLLLGYQNTLESIAFNSFSQLMALGIEVTWAMLVGGAVIGAGLGVAAYFITLRIFITIRRQTRPTDSPSGSIP